MGLLSRVFGPRPLKLDHLLNGKIDLARKGTLSERINFAWTAYTGNHDAKYKTAAFNFLIKSFQIPETTKEEQERKLQALMTLKQKSPDKNFIPSLTDLPKPPPPPIPAVIPLEDRLKLTKLTAIQAPAKTPSPPKPAVQVASKAPVQKPLEDASQKTSDASEATSDEASQVLHKGDEPDFDDSSQVVNNNAGPDFDDASQVLNNNSGPDFDAGADLEEDQFTRFATEVSLEIDTLNKLIERYNQKKDKTEKAQLLFDIYQQQKRMNNQYPAEMMNASTSFRDQIHTNLFKELQEQFKLLGFPSLNEEFLKRNLTTPTPAPDPSSLPEILANMSPEKANKMLELLSKNKTGDLKALEKLYTPDEPGYKEYQTFLAQHKIEFLGGANSRNFKVTSKVDGKELVLKVDNRLDAPKDAEALLRSGSLRDVLSPIYAERTVTHGSDTRNLLVTDYFTGGNLQEHGKKIGDDKARAKSALSVYTQMGSILQKISADGCAFPDMKNSNWLITDKGVVQIADTKSFAFTDAGQLNFSSKANRWYTNLSTPFMNAPEMNALQMIPASADKMHSYMLGKNLYQYLSGCSCSALENKHNGADYDFSHPIFSTPEGVEFREIITATVNRSPDKRISMDMAVERLGKIETKIATRELLKGLKDLNEPTHAEFIRTTSEQIDKASKEQLVTLQEEIKGKITENKEVMTIKAECKELIEQLKTETRDKTNIEKIHSIQKLEDLLSSTSDKTELLQCKNRIETKLDFEKALNAMNAEVPGILAQIKKQGFGEKDIGMNKYINEKMEAMGKVKDKNDIDLLRKDLKETLTKLHDPKQAHETKVIIELADSLRKKFGWGYTDKANRIVDALSQVPISQRGHIQDGNTPEAARVLKAIAHHRHWHKKDVYLTSDGKVDEAKAPQSFTDFKKAMAAIRTDNAKVGTDKVKDERIDLFEPPGMTK